ncbi:MAG: chemotaxis response regulator protein-glutamate methylesterase [FCB group bacterium]|nr:chemotaxis response regulator protein-glutamate methylesterase [FCB group bacterium]
MINAIVIDDSAFMRKAITIMLESDPGIKVMATARDGKEGFELVRQHRPDVVTLDIEMPRTNGLECLDMIMKEVPTPVLVISSLSTKGAETTLTALDKGAVDYIPKTKSYVAIDIVKIQEELLRKIKAVVKTRRHIAIEKRFTKTVSNLKESPASEEIPEIFNLAGVTIKCVAIAVSTGGPPIIHKILNSLPSGFPPVLVAQHMPEQFTGNFADRINSKSDITVKEAETGDVISKGNAYIAKGGKHLLVSRNGIRVTGRITRSPEDAHYHPSADILMNSVAEVYGSSALGLILTGMGKDGVEGLKLLKKSGGKIIAQDEKSCVVFGMPKVAIQQNLPDAVLSVEGIISSLLTITS